MAITGQMADKIELFYVTYPWEKTSYEVIRSLKEIQSEIQRYNHILKIEKAIITKGKEVDFEYIKPKKYKGKPYTYAEKYKK
jgi:hypothetical protein